MDLHWITNALHSVTFDDLWVWMAVMAAALTAMVAVAHILQVSMDAS